MTNMDDSYKERIKYLRRIQRGNVSYDYPQPVESIMSCGGKVTEYILFWDNIDHRALIDADTGKITIYCCPDDDNRIQEHKGDDLKWFNDDIDQRINELMRSVKHDYCYSYKLALR